MEEIRQKIAAYNCRDFRKFINVEEATEKKQEYIITVYYDIHLTFTVSVF